MESMQQVECGWDWAAMVVQMVPWWWLTTAAGWGETATKPLPLPALAQFGNMSREPVVDANHGKEPY